MLNPVLSELGMSSPKTTRPISWLSFAVNSFVRQKGDEAVGVHNAQDCGEQQDSYAEGATLRHLREAVLFRARAAMEVVDLGER